MDDSDGGRESEREIEDDVEPDECRGDSTSPNPPDEAVGAETEATEYRTLAHGVLSPRHRRLAQLAAEGKSNDAIADELSYVPSRVSILRHNQFIAEEIRRLQERIYEETIGSRLKAFAEPALNNIHYVLTDRSNRVKQSEKIDVSKWVIEKLDGKATQKTDIGENLLGVLMDRLDSRSTATRPQALIDVTPQKVAERPAPHPDQPREVKTPKESDELADWIKEFASTQSGE